METTRLVISGYWALLALAATACLFQPGQILAAEATMSATPDATRTTLLSKAKDRGRLPVIVGLAVPEGADGRAVAAAQARLLRDLEVVERRDGTLAGPGLTSVKLFETIPFLAVVAEPYALQRLLDHPLVVSVQEDAAVAP
jgi:hypothetical protein